ncbi:MAG: hypothetical protein AAF862_05875 [Pseudomonadota bacterium]
MLASAKSRLALRIFAPILLTFSALPAEAALIRYTITDAVIYELGSLQNFTEVGPSDRTDVEDDASLTGSFLYDSTKFIDTVSNVNITVSGVGGGFDGSYMPGSVSALGASFESSAGTVIGAPLLSLVFDPFLPTGPTPTLEPVSLVRGAFDPPIFFYSALSIIIDNSFGLDLATQYEISGTLTPTLVPVPAAAPLFGGAIIAGAAALRRRKNAASTRS